MPAPTASDVEAGQEYVAPRDATERKLVQLFEQVLGISPISVTANFFDLGGRSMLAARLFTKILRTFGQELPLSTLFRSPTVELLAKELRPSAPAHEYPTLVPIQQDGSKPPFFCVHGGAGSALFLHQISRRLGDDQPFYGIEPEGLDGKRFLPSDRRGDGVALPFRDSTSAAERALLLWRILLRRTCGLRDGQQLVRNGEEPPVVVLFSAALRYNHLVPPQRLTTPAKPMRDRLRTAVSSPLKVTKNLAIALGWTVRTGTSRHVFPRLASLGLRIPPSMRTSYVTQMLGKAERNYRPMPYPGTIVLFYGPENADYGPKLGWDGLAMHLEHCVIGDNAAQSRRDIMNEPLVELTARELSAFLNGTAHAVEPLTRKGA